MRTSLLIFVLAAFVPFVFVEAQSNGDHQDPKAKELGKQLADLTQKVIDETRDSEVKAQLTQARSVLLENVNQWKLRIDRGMGPVMFFEKIKKALPQFTEAASSENKGGL
ncbi:uncharacterized protein [Periplaneta americana]|uniref:uncharacterized protein n=1 Tax=Periplaneta americana TaxID=6978 RepID=UPI0037E8250B